ncbi:hypothetical protein P8C59_009239 [Phyllachora maydis]|uniref:Extracellular membrane protein CFEM domain-containing protein n=1 Tax=Phyllachora maydis TaxID=1825666 RepID=A0AAD9IEC5_9PEZI|nr:hypothetical protein P8C59_009239 [Phyllachora maydis]
MRPSVVYGVLSAAARSALGQAVGGCYDACLARSVHATDCVDIQCVCTNMTELQNLISCYLSTCSAQQYGPTLESTIQACINGSVEKTVRSLLLDNRDVPPSSSSSSSPPPAVEPDVQSSIDETDDAPEKRDGSIILNINLNFGPGNSMAATSPSNDDVNLAASPLSICNKFAVRLGKLQQWPSWNASYQCRSR